MNAARNFAAAQRAWDNATPSDEPEGLLGDPNLVDEFVNDEHAEEFRDAAFSLVMDWHYSPQDKYAEAKALRMVKELAGRVVEWCEAEDTRRAEQSAADAEDARAEARDAWRFG